MRLYLACLIVAACSAPSAAPPDAGSPTISLTISSGDTIGLAFGQRGRLEVVAASAGGAPAPGTAVGFAIVASLANESAGGATLSAAQVVTDAAGRAAVDVAAGAARARFRVEARADGARTVTFSVTVTDQGFADLVVRPAHVGPRADRALPAITVTLLDRTACDGVDPGAPPTSTFPPRQTADGGTVLFPSLGAQDGFTLVAAASGAAGVIAAGCVEIAASQLRAGATVRFDLPLADRPLVLLPRYTLTSTLDLAPLRDRLAGPGSPWARLACPAGAASLVLDCAIDLLDGGDPDDCVVAAPGPLAAQLQAARAPADASGCRTGGIDAAVMTILVGASGSGAGRLAAVAADLADLLDSLSLTAALAPDGAIAGLALETMTLEARGARFATSLPPTARPLVAAPVVLARDDDALALGTADLTLRLGGLLLTGFAAVGGGDDPRALGAGLVDGVEVCAALSAAACAPAGAAADCLTAACAGAGPLLGAVVAEPFDRLSTAAVDLELDGSALLEPATDGLTAGRLSGGAWRATFRLQNGESVPATGAFDGE